MNRRGRKADYSVAGNVVWLSGSTNDRNRRRADPVASLRKSVSRLIGEVERSGKLRADIAAAIDARRYELYRRSENLGARASDRRLAAAQQLHVASVLRFVHAIAAAAGSERRAGKRVPAAHLDPLSESIRDLEASVMRTRQLSQDVLARCRRDWRAGASPPGPLHEGH